MLKVLSMEEFHCAICSELFIRTMTLACSHSFCEYCIKEWRKTRSTCPICRTKITCLTPTLVLDNYIEKTLLGQSEETRKTRQEMVEQRKELLQMPNTKGKAEAADWDEDEEENDEDYEIEEDDDYDRNEDYEMGSDSMSDWAEDEDQDFISWQYDNSSIEFDNAEESQDISASDDDNHDNQENDYNSSDNEYESPEQGDDVTQEIDDDEDLSYNLCDTDDEYFDLLDLI